MNRIIQKTVSSGNAQMDQILHGGFPANSINILMGEPGTGKTIFVEQMAFHNAHNDDRPILYLTTLSEPLAKVLTYLQSFAFYDEEKVGVSVVYHDIGHELATNGIATLKNILTEFIHSIGPKIIIIDSFKAIHDLSESTASLRKILFELTGLLSSYEATVFLLGEYTQNDSKRYPEFAVADGIVEFLRNSVSSRDERFVRVLKLRGKGYLEGLHGFALTDFGLRIYPRLVSPSLPEHYVLTGKRVATGINGLDSLVGGGLLEGTTTLVAGPTGSGKTTAALQFALEGVNRGEPSLYINFQENPTQLARVIAGLGYDVEQIKEKGLHLYYMSPVELQIDSILVRIFELVKSLGVKRVVIDAVGDLISAASDPSRIHDYLYALNQHFSVSGATTVLTYETFGGVTSKHFNMNGERFSYMADAVIFLTVDSEGGYRRTLSVIKQRASAHFLGAKEYTIDGSGMKLE